MAANENQLRAPAHGFGQEVSFAFQPNQQVPTLDVGGERDYRAGVQGGPVSGGMTVANEIAPQRLNPTMDLLMKVGGQYMEARVKDERAAAFVRGMQRAAAGEAIKDIAEGEPWYSRIFGDGADVIEGARVYTGQAKAAQAASLIEDSMPEIRKLDAVSANAYYSKLVADHMTGDDITDAALMNGFARSLPATMRRQAKEHFAWRQEEASTAESRALLSAADLLQKRANGDKQTDNEYAAEAVKFIAGMRPAAGRDVESWTKARTADLMSLARDGKFHAVNAIKQAGMLDMLPSDSRAKIEQALDSAENRTIAAKSFEYADEIGRIAGQAEVFSTDLSPENTRAQLAALNERFRRETGIDRDLVSLDKGGGIVKDAWVTILREGERRIRERETAAAAAAEKGDKALADAYRKQGADHAISLGQAGVAARSLPDGIVHERFMDAWRRKGAQGPDAQAQLLMLNYSGAGSGDGYVNPAIKQLYERRTEIAIGGQMPAEFLKLHEEYTAIKGQNPALADAYFGKHAARMALFDSLLTDGKPGDRNESVAFVSAFGSQELPRPKQMDKKARAAAVKSLEDAHDSSWWKFLNQQREPLRSDQSEQAVAAIEPQIERFMSMPGMTSDQAVRRAMEQSKREQGTDMLGGFFVRGVPGQQPLTSILRTHRPGIDSAAGTGDDAADYWDAALKGIVADRAKKHGADVKDPIAIVRNPDVNGVAWLDVYYTAADGRQLPVRISSDDIKNYARSPSGRKVSGAVTK